VAPEEDVEAKVSALVEKTRHAVVTDLDVKVEGVAVHDLCPGRLPDLFLGGEVAVLGRYAGEGSAVIRVRGRTPSGPREWVQEVVFPRAGGEGTGVARLWAVRRIGALLDEIRRRGESKEVVAEIVRLAKRHGVLTPYTSWLVLEDEAVATTRHGADGGGRKQDDLDGRLRDLAAAGPAPPPAPRPAGSLPGTAAGAVPEAPRADSGEASVRRSLEAKGMAEARDGEERLEEKAKDARRRLREVARSVAGRAFYLRGDRWVEAGLTGDETRRRVKAWSDEHLALARRDTATAGALALGRVVLRVGDEVVEVEEVGAE
jgi:Ca-activated chloride channel family protein